MTTTTPITPAIPNDEEAARTLAAHLHGMGVTAFVHWDRSPWGVRIPLTADESEHAPSLFVLTENQPVSEDGGGRRWFGQLGGFHDDLQDDLTETFFEWYERSWLGDDTGTIATSLRTLLLILTHGVA